MPNNLPEKRCGNCLFCNSNNYCLPKSSSVSPMREGCDSWELKDGARETPPEANENSSETSKNGARSKVKKKRTKTGGRTSKTDREKLKELYNEGVPYREMLRILGVKSQGTIGFHVSKLIASGELIKRREKHPKRTTKPAINEQSGKVAKLTSPRETPIETEPAGSVTKDKPGDIQDDISDNDLQYTKDLMQGAEKIVIYHKNLKHTIEFNQKGE